MYTNKLIHEKSPYLLQHAHNPVDWNPWGEEAFAMARREDKPVFLSIGYSTCHWCHVMERESFESPEVAAVLNRHFVPIKVDREERPDVDHVYMTYVQATTGGGGWPMSVWLTPEGKPFYGGTYFPPADMYGRPGFVTVLEKLAEAWSLQRERIVQSSESVLEQIRAQVEPEPGDAGRLDASVSDGAFQVFRRVFDPRHGGFGDAPKFPRPVTLNFLLRYWARTRNREALEMVLLTLRGMAGGGMNDQLGGGFHRYSVDERWFLPHFEKMLYDQAQLAVSCLEAYQATGEAFFAGVARRTLDYVLRDMTHPDGPFYSAEDADSVIDAAEPERKGEGAFYVWSAGEIGEVLGEPEAGWFCHCYGVEPGGNVGQDPHGEFANRNILFESRPAGEAAAGFGVPEERLRESLAAARRKLLEARERRVRPHLDDKVLVSWNALMISAFARGAQVLGERRYEEAAVRAAEFVLGRMYDAGTGGLMRRYRDGETAVPAFLDDYAFLGLAMADLYETVFEPRYLETAVRLAEALLARFEDPVRGGFFAAGEGDASLVIRLKDDYDGAEPSGNSMAVLALLRLGHATGRADFLRSADRALGALAGRLTSMPEAMPQLLVALEFLLAAPKQIVLTGERGDPVAQAMCRAVWERFLPGRILLFAGAPGRESIVRLAPALGELAPAGGRPAAYVCENFTCRLPVTGVEALAELLQ